MGKNSGIVAWYLSEEGDSYKRYGSLRAFEQRGWTIKVFRKLADLKKAVEGGDSAEVVLVGGSLVDTSGWEDGVRLLATNGMKMAIPFSGDTETHLDILKRGRDFGVTMIRNLEITPESTRFFSKDSPAISNLEVSIRQQGGYGIGKAGLR